MAHFVDQRETQMHHADTIDGMPFIQDSLLANIFGQDQGNNVISQYIDVGDSTTEHDPYYAYADPYADHTPVDSPISTNASLVSGHNNNDSFYNQSNDSYVQRSSEVQTSTTPLEQHFTSDWKVSHHEWDTLTPTEFEQPPHLHADCMHSVPRYNMKQENHYFAPHFPTPTSATATQITYTPMQPQIRHSVSYPGPEHPYTQNHTHYQHRPHLPTPEENPSTISFTSNEEPFHEQYIPQESVRRLENYLQRVKDVHIDDEMHHSDENKTDSDVSVVSTSPVKVKNNRVKKPRNRRSTIKRENSMSTVKQIEKRDKEDAENKPYVPIVDALRKNSILWEKVQCMKKKGIYKCSHCPGVFNSLLELAKHLDEFEVVRPYRCPFTDCPWYALGLPRRAEVRRHCAAQHAHIVQFGCEMDAPEPASASGSAMAQEAEKFQCSSPLCEKVFKRKDACQRHVKLVHNNPVSRFNRRVDNLREKFQTDDVDELLNLMKTTNSHK